MSTTTCNVRGKAADGGIIQKMGPMKATIPMASLLRPSNGNNSTVAGSAFSAMSPPMRLISPDHNTSGHRSPGAVNYFKGKQQAVDPRSMSSCMRRTASLDALYMKPSWKIAQQFQLQQQSSAFTILQLDKATQTDETSIGPNIHHSLSSFIDCTIDDKTDKLTVRQKQRVQRDSGNDHSVSSQTLSSIHTSPVTIPIRPCSSQRPMRSSVEGLNQEIEKLVLLPNQPQSESIHFPRGIPEGHRAPLADILHCDTRSVNTQTPNRDHLSSDESQSTSPDDNATTSGGTEASPRINRFLARLPPDGCEKVCLKSTDIDHTTSTASTIFKPTVAFKLRPSLGSAFQPLQPIAVPSVQDAANISGTSPTADT